MTPFIISQVLAFITLIIGMVAFQCKDRQNLLRGWFFAAMFAAAHFYYLDNIEAAVILSVAEIKDCCTL